ncbi:MAG: hypothetical protein LBV79_11340 [Candidatus Adiutrix sp.]|jgi:hypothetical protein|nr:hypothetical protein [Candidatus Adiutrix sp.]
MPFRASIALALMLKLLAAAAASAQLGQGAEGPAAAELNRTFAKDSWAMYGAPQDAPLDENGFGLLASRVEQTLFAASQVQIVVIRRGADASGTIGLIEKRGRRVTSTYLRSADQDVYAVWHQVGYRTSPDRLSSDFRENVLAAEEAYRDLPLTFNSVVRGVGKDESGEVFVEFPIRGRSAGVLCYPWAGAPQGVDLQELRGGAKVRASGQFSSYGRDGGIVLRGCLFSRP